MEGESLLETIYEDVQFDDDSDVVESEEKFSVNDEEISRFSSVLNIQGENSASIYEAADSTSIVKTAVEGNEKSTDYARTGSLSKNQRKRLRKKKNRGSNNISHVNRFVINTCRYLKEPKSYLVWEAVKKLGEQAVRDLVEEVKIIERNGGQLTADGRRRRTLGGILWNVLKARSPDAYQQIMKAGKEFERELRNGGVKRNMPELPNGQFQIKRPRIEETAPNILLTNKCSEIQVNASKEKCMDLTCQTASLSNCMFGSILCHNNDNPSVQAWVNGIKASNAFQDKSCKLATNGHIPSESEKKTISVKDRIRFPIVYNDLFDP